MDCFDFSERRGNLNVTIANHQSCKELYSTLMNKLVGALRLSFECLFKRFIDYATMRLG